MDIRFNGWIDGPHRDEFCSQCGHLLTTGGGRLWKTTTLIYWRDGLPFCGLYCAEKYERERRRR